MGRRPEGRRGLGPLPVLEDRTWRRLIPHVWARLSLWAEGKGQLARGPRDSGRCAAVTHGPCSPQISDRVLGPGSSPPRGGRGAFARPMDRRRCLHPALSSPSRPPPISGLCPAQRQPSFRGICPGHHGPPVLTAQGPQDAAGRGHPRLAPAAPHIGLARGRRRSFRANGDAGAESTGPASGAGLWRGQRSQGGAERQLCCFLAGGLCVCVRVCVHEHACARVLHALLLCACVCTCACVHKCVVHVHVYTRVCAHVFVCVPVCAHVCPTPFQGPRGLNTHKHTPGSVPAGGAAWPVPLRSEKPARTHPVSPDYFFSSAQNRTCLGRAEMLMRVTDT